MLNKMKANLAGLDDPFEMGGNYFELIEFTLTRRLPDGREISGIYGVNVVKVREVVHMPKINPLSSSVPGIAGVFELRGVPIPAVNLCRVLGDQASPITSDQQIIVTEFSQKRAGFIVDTTNRIRRVTWDKILPPAADSGSSITGMMLIEDSEFLFILDLEKIIAQLENQAHGFDQLNPNLRLDQTMSTRHGQMTNLNFDPGAASVASRNLHAPGVLLVDDSNLILNNISRALLQEGYRVIIARNGLEALSRLEEAKATQSPYGSIQLVITDLEMPQMDGISFIKKVRERSEFTSLPIYLHTSLGDTGSKTIGEKVGANGYFVKNDLITITRTLKKHLSAA